LTYRELFSIHAVCEWCASSAVIMTVLLGCAIARYLVGGPLPEDSTADARVYRDDLATGYRDDVATPRA